MKIIMYLDYADGDVTIEIDHKGYFNLQIGQYLHLIKFLNREQKDKAEEIFTLNSTTYPTLLNVLAEDCRKIRDIYWHGFEEVAIFFENDSTHLYFIELIGTTEGSHYI